MVILYTGSILQDGFEGGHSPCFNRFTINLLCLRLFWYRVRVLYPRKWSTSTHGDTYMTTYWVCKISQANTFKEASQT